MASKSVPVFKRWFKPEIYPLVAMVGAAVSFMTYTGIRSIMIAPDVLIRKELRKEGGAPCTETQGQGYRHGFVREVTKKYYDFNSTSSALHPANKE